MEYLQHDLKHIIEKYESNKRNPISFDFKTSTQSILNDKYKRDNRYIHHIHYYPGRIYHYIPLYLLSLENFASLDGYLLDPFAGSGTILLESIINPIIKRNSLGVEINPLARLISKVKTTPIDCSKIDQLMTEIYRGYNQSLDLCSYIPVYKTIDLWFSNKAMEKLAKLKSSIENLDVSEKYKDFFWVCFSSVVRKVSKADPYIPPPVVLKIEKYKENTKKYQKLESILKQAEDPDVWELFKAAVGNNKTKLEILYDFEEVKSGEIKAEIIWKDAKSIEKGILSERGRIASNSSKPVPSNSVDIIFTSPPYLTAQKYIRTAKLELLWLGYSEKEIIDLDKTSIGSERISQRQESSILGVSSIDSLVDYTISKSKERGLMVYKYFEDMIMALREMYRLLNKRGYVFLVVGDNRVLGRRVDTYKLLRDAAIDIGFTEVVTMKDEIRTRSMITVRNGTGGLIKDEYIVILKKGS
jgi:DNA modification methylase